MSGALFIAAPLIIDTLYGSNYEDACVVFRILSVNYFFSSTFRILSGNLLVTQRKLHFNLFISVISSMVNVVGDLLLVPKFESIGAAIATLVAELSQMSIQFSFSGDYIYKNIDKMDIGKIIISTSTAYIITNLVQNYIKWNSFTSLIIDTVIFFLVYILLMISLKGKCFTDMIRFLRNKGLKLCRNNSQSKC